MRYFKTTDILKLRDNHQLLSETLGFINNDTTCYYLEETFNYDGIDWHKIFVPLQTGEWKIGWSASAYEGTTLLEVFTPHVKFASSYQQPVYLTQMFAERPDAYKRFGLFGHNGVDFSTGKATPIYALAPGIAVHSRDNPTGYGLYIRVDGATCSTIYGHFSKVYVQENEPVSAGQLLGLEGNSGNSSGIHSHQELRLIPFEERFNNGFQSRVDVLPYMDWSNIIFPKYVDILNQFK